MSHTTMYAIAKDGTLEIAAEYSNAWGSAARVWESLRERYLPEMSNFLSDASRIWELWEREDLPDSARLVLLATFDYAIIEGDRLPEMAQHFRAFARDFPTQGADHCLNIARDLDELARTHKENLLGVCFRQTSVSENVWVPWDEKGQKQVVYDFLCGERHFFVFQSLEEQKAWAEAERVP